MKLSSSAIALLGITALIGLLISRANAQDEGSQGASHQVVRAEATETSASVASPVYKPPVRGAPATRVGGGTRGVDDSHITLRVLDPSHVGFTIKEQPTLHWYASESTINPVEATIVNEDTKQTLLEIHLEKPLKAGVHALPLKDQGVRLQPDVEYLWQVALVKNPDSRSQDILSGGVIKRVEPTDALRSSLKHAVTGELPSLYAEAGLWYDAVEEISALIQATPDDRGLREQRAALLEQVGLVEVAAYDRAAAN